MRDLRPIPLVFLFTLCLAASAVQAGNGTIDDGKLHIDVMFAYREADPDSWRPMFEEASRLLYNATNGQLQLGHVRVSDCWFDGSDADIWILDNAGGAFANVFDPEEGTGLGGIGHIFMSQTHKSTGADAFGPFGFVHEFGHYGFGLYDEYDGFTEPARDFPAEQGPLFRAPNQFCVTDDDPVACLMDGGTTIVPNNARTEFCTHAAGGLSTAHNPGVVVGGLRYINAQEYYHSESCWETVARLAGLTEPVVVNTVDPPGLDPIQWEVIDGRSRVVICLDRSGSMEPREIEVVKTASKQLVDLLHQETILPGGNPALTDVEMAGEDLAVVSFARIGTVDFPMQELMDLETKDAARAVIDELRVSGVTSVGEGLQTALDEIEAQGERACSESIILLTDGINTTGLTPEEVGPALAERHLKLFAVALGEDADTETLRELATMTGGLFYHATTAEELTQIFTEIAGAIRSGGTVVATGSVTTGESQTIAVRVDSFSEEVTSVLNWDEGILDLTITTPSGDVIDVESAASRPDVEAVRRDAFIYIRVFDPEPGEWLMRIDALEVPDETEFDLTVLAQGRGISVTASTDRGIYDFPDPVRLRVDVIGNVPVAGAEVEAEVIRPAGAPVTIPLFDDGDPVHGDAFANDGVYQALFNQYSGEGVYAFRVMVVNENGTGPDPSLPFVEDGADPTAVPVPQFYREVEVSVIVRGVPGVIEGELEFRPATLNVGSSGNWVTTVIELPEPFSAGDIDVSTVRLNGGVEPEPHPIVLGDDDGDGIPDLKLKFDRSDVIALLPTGLAVEVTVDGGLTGGEPFSATDVISVFDPQATTPVLDPSGSVRIGEPVALSWDVAAGERVVYRGFISRDGGLSWLPIFGPIQISAHTWVVTGPPTDDARIVIEARSVESVVQVSMSGPFIILDETVAVPGSGLSTAFLGVESAPGFGSAAFRYTLAAPSPVRLDVYDVTGRLVRRLVGGDQDAGVHVATWSGDDRQDRSVPNGLYFFVFETGATRATGRVMMIH